MKKIMKNGKINGLLDVYGIIYLVKNKVNGKCYVGQTYQKNGFKDRYRAKYNQSLTEALYSSIVSYPILMKRLISLNNDIISIIFSRSFKDV